MSTSVPGWVSVVVIGSAVAVALAVIAGLFATLRASGVPARQRAAAFAGGAAIVAGWLTLDLVLAGGHRLAASTRGFPWLGLAVAAPLVAGYGLYRASSAFRAAVGAVPRPLLMYVQTARVLGGVFLVLLGLHELPARFALPAGIGDVTVGVAAPLVAWAYASRRSWSRNLAIAFNAAGILDLIVAVGVGFLSAPSPIRVFGGTPSTAIMALMPMALIPIFLVPLAVLTHVASLQGLLAERRPVPAWTPRRTTGLLGHRA